MYAASMKWRAEFGVDTILDDFHFQERDAFISLYPQGYHKTDKFVSAPLHPACIETPLACYCRANTTHCTLYPASIGSSIKSKIEAFRTGP